MKGVNPKVGLIWEPRPDVQVFADVTRSMDVPDFTDLTQNLNGTTGTQSCRLRRRRRGRRRSAAAGALIADLGHHSLLFWKSATNCFSSRWRQGVRPRPSTRRRRAIRCRTGRLGRDLADILGPAKGDTLTLSQLWNYSDFRSSTIRFMAATRLPARRSTSCDDRDLPASERFLSRAIVDFIPTGTWVDYANTLRAPSQHLVNLQTGVQTANGALLYLDARNLTDRRYISDFGTVTDARTPQPPCSIRAPAEHLHGMRFALN